MNAMMSQPDVQFVAVCDVRNSRREAIKNMVDSRYGTKDCAMYPEINDFLETRTDIDAVLIATRHHLHAGLTLRALQAGKHVLVEKPLGTTVAECRRILKAAEGHQGVVWMGLEYRYKPPIEALIHEVRSGAVGNIKMIFIREHRFPFLPKVGDWNRFNRFTGGTLVEKCCHFFDLMNQIVGDEPVRVMASGAQDVNHLDESYDGETPDILLTYSSN